MNKKYILGIIFALGTYSSTLTAADGLEDPFAPSSETPARSAPREFPKMHPEPELANIYAQLDSVRGSALHKKLEEYSEPTKKILIPILDALANKSSLDTRSQINFSNLVAYLPSDDTNLSVALGMVNTLFSDVPMDAKLPFFKGMVLHDLLVFPQDEGVQMKAIEGALASLTGKKLSGNLIYAAFKKAYSAELKK
jgi:hypothetical protein